MRTIQSLVKTSSRVWLYFENDAVCRQFLSMAAQEGFTFCNGEPLSEKHCYPVLGIHEDKTVAFLSVTIWMQSFASRKSGKYGIPPRVDFAKYISGCPEYECTSPQFSGYLQAGNN